VKLVTPIVVMVSVIALATGCRTAAKGDTAEPTQQPTPEATAVAPAGPDVAPSPTPDETAEEPSLEPPDAEDATGGSQSIQEDALESCDHARQLLDAGQTDDAIAAVDRAYELMLSIPDTGSGDSLQTKEDIRRLVAELLARCYKVQRAPAPMTSLDLSLAIVDNDQVQREIKSFTGPERQYFLDAYRRSGLFRPMILDKLQAAGLPSQLSWLPLVESLFKERAMSRAAAVGLWQFIASTGQRYGLARNAWVDDRMDPERSTDAAIAYLTELHGLFGDWPKALAAYNCGEAQVQRLQGRNASEYQDFWDLYAMLPQETRRYVPRFFATLVILADPAKFGITLPEPLPAPADSATVRVARAVQLDRLDAELSLPTGTLRDLNPALRHGATPPQPYDLRVPAGVAEAVPEHVASLPEWQPPRPLTISHRVGRGETLSTIARRYGTSVEAIMRANRIRSANRIWPGQRLEIPVRGAGRSSAPPADPGADTYTVRRGDTLSAIARRYRTSVDRLRQLNGLTSDGITPGQVLRLRGEATASAAGSGATRYQVRSGDSPASIASAHKVALADLLAANNLTTRSRIYPGQWLVIPR
jgi:membrane-bound lytic murein transglycosylase D